MKVLVTGARGQLAGAIVDVFAQSAEVLACPHADLDISDFGAVMSRVGADRPDVILNCASYNAVDRAEDEPEQAMAVNALAVRVLARAAVEYGATLVYFSSDFVFDGKATSPYTEDDLPNPQSVYAQSKLLGEWFALEAPGAFVLRVESLFGGRNAKSSIDRICEALKTGTETKVFADRTVTPSYVFDVAAATRALLERGEPGLYHCVSSGHATWYDVGKEIARLVGGQSEQFLKPVSVEDVQLRAPRPKFAALANTKLSRTFAMPTWQDALRRYIPQQKPAVDLR